MPTVRPRFRVQYHRAKDLLKDHDEQFRLGGVLVRVEPPKEVRPMDKVELEIEAGGRSIVCEAEVAQIHPGFGVAVLFDAARLKTMVESAKRLADVPGAPPEHAFGRNARRGAAARADDDLDNPDTYARYRKATPIQRVQLAVHGNKTARNLALRDVTNRQLPLFVLRNPNLALDEVVAIAKMSEVSAEALIAIAERGEWSKRPEIASALVRNPKTPIPIAVAMVKHVDTTECRRLAKANNVRMPIKQAAGRRVAALSM